MQCTVESNGVYAIQIGFEEDPLIDLCKPQAPNTIWTSMKLI